MCVCVCLSSVHSSCEESSCHLLLDSKTFFYNVSSLRNENGAAQRAQNLCRINDAVNIWNLMNMTDSHLWWNCVPFHRWQGRPSRKEDIHLWILFSMSFLMGCHWTHHIWNYTFILIFWDFFSFFFFGLFIESERKNKQPKSSFAERIGWSIAITSGSNEILNRASFWREKMKTTDWDWNITKMPFVKNRHREIQFPIKLSRTTASALTIDNDDNYNSCNLLSTYDIQAIPKEDSHRNVYVFEKFGFFFSFSKSNFNSIPYVVDLCEMRSFQQNNFHSNVMTM